jgi:hypothetical protein
VHRDDPQGRQNPGQHLLCESDAADRVGLIRAHRIAPHPAKVNRESIGGVNRPEFDAGFMVETSPAGTPGDERITFSPVRAVLVGSRGLTRPARAG